ncbi:MAG: hypothetical protein AAGG48_28645 [Planctomycetota bacterium]
MNKRSRQPLDACHPQDAPSELPYRQGYGRFLVLSAVVATLCFPLLHDSTWVTNAVRGFAGTYGLGIALLWAPVLLYAGIRTKCTADWSVALIGLSTLVFWIPWLVFA